MEYIYQIEIINVAPLKLHLKDFFIYTERMPPYFKNVCIRFINKKVIYDLKSTSSKK